MLNKMLLSKATLVSTGSFCQVVLKLLPISKKPLTHTLSKENIERIIFIHPKLPSSCINTHLRGPFSDFARQTIMDAIFFSESEEKKVGCSELLA